MCDETNIGAEGIPLMAKVTITFKDKPNGAVDTTVDFDPPIEAAGSATPAQRLAVQALDGLMAKNKHSAPRATGKPRARKG
jgi:hypothetical protein